MNNLTIMIALAILLVMLAVASIAAGNGKHVGGNGGNGGHKPTPYSPLAPPTHITPYSPLAPSSLPIPPFAGWATGGNQYVIDYGTQYSLSNWQGVVPNDANPIACPNQTLVPGVCATDLATAGSVCDNTPGCIGLVYNISDPVYPTVTPVNTTPVQVPSGSSTGNGYGSVFLTPLANETSGDVYASVEAQPNTVWSVTPADPARVGSSAGAIIGCYTNNQQTAGSCGGVLIPTYDSLYQQKSLQGGMIAGIQYDSLATYAPSTQFTNAISLTYTTA
jgi:hypothetical protein